MEIRPASAVRNLESAHRNRWPWLALLLLALTIIAYLPVRYCDFINYDDLDYVTVNPHVQSGLTWNGIIWAFTTGHAANWHPLTWLSHMFDVQLFGLNPVGHHLTNLVLHIANTLVLFWLIMQRTGAPGRSLFVAALFAVHPLHVESVAWIAERKDVLSTLFWLLTLCAYTSYVRQPRLSCYLVMLALFAAGLLSKPMLVTLPFVLLLLDFWPLRRWTLTNRSQIAPLIREKIPLFVLALASSIVTVFVQQSGRAVIGLGRIPLSSRIANAFASYALYIERTI